MISLYNERRTAQALAWLLHSGGPMHAHKLLRLVYQAERYSLSRHGILLTGDEIVATPFGPVPKHTQEILNGISGDPLGICAWVRVDHDLMCHLSVLGNSEEIDSVLGALSDSDVECLQASLSLLGRCAVSELAGSPLTTSLIEWSAEMNPGEAIPLPRILSALCYTPAQSQAIVDQAMQQAQLGAVLNSTP